MSFLDFVGGRIVTPAPAPPIFQPEELPVPQKPATKSPRKPLPGPRGAAERRRKGLSTRLNRPWDLKPELGSIYAELQKTPREKLLTPPMRWKQQQLDILGVTWRQLPSVVRPPHGPIDSLGIIEDVHPNTCVPLGWEEMYSCLKKLTSSDSAEWRHPAREAFSMKRLLYTMWPGLFGRVANDTLDLMMDGVVFPACVHTQFMYALPGSDNQGPDTALDDIDPTEPASFWRPKYAVGYVSRADLARVRHNLDARPTRKNKKKPPAPPRNDVPTDRDPHLAGMFLGMAQRHFYASPIIMNRRRYSRYVPWDDSPREPALGDVKLRIMSFGVWKPDSFESDAAHFIVYTATVKRDFLQRFTDPFLCVPGEDGKQQGLDIEYTYVPVWPIIGLRERLGTALGKDLVGPFNEFCPRIDNLRMGSPQYKAEKEFAKNVVLATFPTAAEETPPQQHDDRAMTGSPETIDEEQEHTHEVEMAGRAAELSQETTEGFNTRAVNNTRKRQREDDEDAGLSG